MKCKQIVRKLCFCYIMIVCPLSKEGSPKFLNVKKGRNLKKSWDGENKGGKELNLGIEKDKGQAMLLLWI